MLFQIFHSIHFKDKPLFILNKAFEKLFLKIFFNKHNFFLSDRVYYISKKHKPNCAQKTLKKREKIKKNFTFIIIEI